MSYQSTPVGRLIKGPRDFWAGCIYVGLAAAIIIIARHYPMGTAFRMGAAYFPTLLGWLLLLIGAASLARSFLKAGDPLPPFAWRQLTIICGAVVLFAVLVEGAGLIPALLVLVGLASVTSSKFKLRTTVVLAVCIAVFCYVVFIKGLELNLPGLGPWLGF